MIVKMLPTDAAIGDESALRPKAESDPLRDAGERRGQRRPDGAVENPDRSQAVPAQQRDQTNEIEAALQFRPGMLKIDRGRDARFCREQLFRGAGRRREERHLPLRSRRGDGADKRQMPDDVANSRLNLNDRKGRHIGRHIDCCSMSCDMSFVMQLNG